MNAAERAALKEEIRAELREELRAELASEAPKVRRENPHWEAIKQLVVASYPDKRTYEHYQIISGLSPVVRHIFGLNQIKHISEEQAEAVKAALGHLLRAAGRQ